jgi:hypothetical protein
MRASGAWAAPAAASIAGGVYVATMYPGLVGIGDTPKLQFVGSVLGTPHSPGYPLYVLLSWLFAHIPIGTIAYRVNLLSVASGAMAAGLFTLVLRELGCRPAIAFAGALAIAFGNLFWSQAILAEVYALNAALFAGVLFYLLRWSRTRAASDLRRAILVFALGLAHHLTLAMTAPALLAFTLVVDRRVVTPRIAAFAILACAAGLSSYAFIWIRTSQGAPFIEAHAQSIGDLVLIVTGRQFQRALSALTLRELVIDRVPLIASWIVSELRWLGVLLCAAGVAALWRHRRAHLLLLSGCAVLVTIFALDYKVFDVQVFLLIPMIACGLLAGVGLEAAAARLNGAIGPALLAVAALLVPAAQYRANVHNNNHHRHTFEMRYFAALFDALPDRSAIVTESYPVDSMIRYELIAERRGRGRRIELIDSEPAVVRRYLENGYKVFAFAEGRATLEFNGVTFEPLNLPLPAPTSGRHVADTEVPQLAFGLSAAVP